MIVSEWFWQILREPGWMHSSRCWATALRDRWRKLLAHLHEAAGGILSLHIRLGLGLGWWNDQDISRPTKSDGIPCHWILPLPRRGATGHWLFSCGACLEAAQWHPALGWKALRRLEHSLRPSADTEALGPACGFNQWQAGMRVVSECQWVCRADLLKWLKLWCISPATLFWSSPWRPIPRYQMIVDPNQFVTETCLMLSLVCTRQYHTLGCRKIGWVCGPASSQQHFERAKLMPAWSDFWAKASFHGPQISNLALCKAGMVLWTAFFMLFE